MKRIPGEVWFCLFCGLAGGLIGYGREGSVQAACLYAGCGLIAPVVAVVVLLLFAAL